MSTLEASIPPWLHSHRPKAPAKTTPHCVMAMLVLHASVFHGHVSPVKMLLTQPIAV